MNDLGRGSRQLLVVGVHKCDSSLLDDLDGAKRDADRMYSLLVDPTYGDYDTGTARKLLSPTREELIEQLNEVLFAASPPDVFTFCFSGHGASRDTGYYCVLRDTLPSNLAGTGFPLSQLFAMIGEAKPRQAFVLLDSCEAGGLVTDLRKLASPDVLGSKGSTSISIFASSCSNQTAKENDLGGYVTQEIAKCINGEHIIDSDHEYLDLVHVGTKVSSVRSIAANDQEPTFWGLHLTGQAEFVRNPHFDAGETKQSDYTGLPASSTEGVLIAEHSSGLREIFLKLSEGFDPRELVQEIQFLYRHLDGDLGPIETIISGISSSFPSGAIEHSDPFVEIEILASCISATMPLISTEYDANALIRAICINLLRVGLNASDECRLAIQANKMALRSNMHGLPDLFFIPLRISKLLGWTGAFVLIADRLGINLEEHRRGLEELCDLVLEHYSGSLLSMSDEQAPYLLTFLLACKSTQNMERAESILSYMLHDFLNRKGNIAAPEKSGKDVLDFLFARHFDDYEGVATALARPTELFSVLIYGTRMLGLPELLDFDIQELDHLPFNIFVPDDYREFGHTVVDQGVNFTFSVGSEVGLGVFELSDFERSFDSLVLAKIQKAKFGSVDTVAIGSLLSSLLFPNRVCWLLAD